MRFPNKILSHFLLTIKRKYGIINEKNALIGEIIMNTQQLESFVQVAEDLNFARAAEALNITQSAVSRQIHSLED